MHITLCKHHPHVTSVTTVIGAKIEEHSLSSSLNQFHSSFADPERGLGGGGVGDPDPL